MSIMPHNFSIIGTGKHRAYASIIGKIFGIIWKVQLSV